MTRLIANSGLHFTTINVELNPDEPVMLPDGKSLKYTFLETIDFLNGGKVKVDLCVSKDSCYSPVSYLKNNDLLELAPNGTTMIETNGLPKIKKDAVMAIIENYPTGDEQLVNINSLSALRFNTKGEMRTGFELLLGKWLPMPMYEQDISGQSCGYPNGWCRVKIDPVGERKKNGMQNYRCTWAFDTRLGNDAVEGVLRPTFLDQSSDRKVYSLCNRADILFGNFLNIPDGQNDAPVGDYLVSLFDIDLRNNQQHKFKFLGYYIYFINALRLIGAAPEVTLYSGNGRTIPVDMSIDIGNSRTCAVLFENGQFDKARILRMRDLSEPWRAYESAFDMRLVFRRADFGGDITFDKTLFQWPSIVRVGEEAKHLIYKSQEGVAESERTTNYSSPKRYLWDNKTFESRWELMVTNDDPTTLKVNPQVFVEGFTDYFDSDGTYLDHAKEVDLFALGDASTQCHYSRASLMTFVMIEIFQQAYSYINSTKFRDMHGEIDRKRCLRNIIITCPTAMPLKEQQVLRIAAKDASRVLCRMNPGTPEITIIPDPEKLKPTDDITVLRERGWLYDEAFACQLVYLYAELAERYKGNIAQFFNLKGHVREDMAAKGFDSKSLTIGTIDIGAGTTDVMLAAYGQHGDGRLTPVPLFYDSFYTAGDDIIYNIIRDVILEGPTTGIETMGSIANALGTRLRRMSFDEIQAIPRVADTKRYSDMIESMRQAISEDEVATIKEHLINELMQQFFASNASTQSEKDRRTRLDFCTQISIPMAQFFLEKLNLGRPSTVVSFDELFPKEKPASYLLDSFAYHFGFRFEELNWRYEPDQIGKIVSDTMEPLIKVLSVIMYAHHCDILVLSGRPTSLKPLTDLFIKYVPIAPNRLVCLDKYRVGRWYPFATDEGYFQEQQKAIVAVGAEVGHIASTVGFNGLVLDFKILSTEMKSTTKYFGHYKTASMEVGEPFLTPQNSTAMLKGISVFPYFIGCKQFNSAKYQGRPLYAIYNHSGAPSLNIMIQRNYYEDRETLILEEATNMEGESLRKDEVELRLQSIADDGNFWMDKGAFSLKIQQQ